MCSLFGDELLLECRLRFQRLVFSIIIYVLDFSFVLPKWCCDFRVNRNTANLQGMLRFFGPMRSTTTTQSRHARINSRPDKKKNTNRAFCPTHFEAWPCATYELRGLSDRV